MMHDIILVLVGMVGGYMYHSFKYAKELEVKKKALTREIKIWQMRNGRNADGL